MLAWVFIAGTFVWFKILEYKRRALWDGLYTLVKTGFSHITGLLYVIKDIFKDNNEAAKIMTGCVSDFIVSTDAQETAAAYLKTRAALINLDELIKRYPSVYESDGYLDFKNKMMKNDEKINFAARFYDENVLIYNKWVKRTPFNFVAVVFNIKVKGMLKIN